MRAAIYERTGEAREVLRVVELDKPDPGPGEVRVRVVYSAVNPTDWKIRSGNQRPEMDYPFQVPNQDGSGVIDAIGDGVDASRMHERVWLYFTAYQRQFGSASEWVCVPAHLAITLPEGISFELGASLGVPALTAHHALFVGDARSNAPVLVQGGAGAVGHFAIELAKWAGKTVVTTVSSSEKAERARLAGADYIVNYKTEDVAAVVKRLAPHGVARIVEVAPENLALDARLIAPHGTVVFYASTGFDPPVPVRPLMTVNVTLLFMLLYGLGREALDAGCRAITEALCANALSELPVVRFTLEEIADAHVAVERATPGKVLVQIG